MNDTTESTNTLKGFAILAVMINHYLNINMKGNFHGYGNLWVAFFFIVSGYGIYLSLSRRLHDGKHRLMPILQFYYSRGVRIFPLFWITYLFNNYWFAEPVSVWGLIGVHTTIGGILWFIPALLQCYLIAPVIFLLMRASRLMTLIVLCCAFVAIHIAWSLSPADAEWIKAIKFLHLNWQFAPCLYLFVFSFSMLLSEYLSSWNRVSRAEKKWHIILLTALILVLMVAAKRVCLSADPNSPTCPGLVEQIAIKTIGPLVAMMLLSIYVLASRMSIRFISWLGKTSYPIYLFHLYFILFISGLFKFSENSIWELLVCLAAFPVFLYACHIIDKWNNRQAAFCDKWFLKILTSPAANH